MALCVVCSSEIRDDARFCPSCGAEQPRSEVAGTDADPLMGKVVARKFKVEKLLGVGGMGKVYKARQLSLDKAVVVKVLHDHFREDPQLVQRFQREAKAASRLNHPNSIQIIDFGQDDGGVVFMAMEFLQGQDLFSLLKKEGPLSAERIARVMVQVCSALAEAHEQNVIHRDLKPENIMVEDRRGQRDFVKVLDFGIAKIQDPGEGQQQLTQAGMVCGTPEYMSPEQARGLQLDPRSDIYALGVVMYQLAIGELPFTADTPIGIVTKHILEKPVAPRLRAPKLDVPVELETIIMTAMEKEPDKRFATVSALGEALEGMVVNLGFTQARSSGSLFVGSSGSASNPAVPPASAAPVAQNSMASPAAAAPGTAVTPIAAAALPQAPSNTASSLRKAALVFAVITAVGLAVVLAVRPSAASRRVDAGTAASVDAGAATVVFATPDAGLARSVDAGSGAVASGSLDAGTTPPPRDAGSQTVDAGTKKPVVKEPKEPKDPKDPKMLPAERRAKARELFDRAHAAVAEKDCGKAMPDLAQVRKLDPSITQAVYDIALCQRRNGDDVLACKAADAYAQLKHLAPGDKLYVPVMKVLCPSNVK